MNKDVIFRQDAINALENDIRTAKSEDTEELWISKIGAQLKLAGLPSAQPELSEEEMRLIKKLRSYHNGTYANVIDKLLVVASAQPCTDEQIQKMQELEQAEIEKAFQLGREDVLSEIVRCKDCRWGREACGNIECFADTNVPPEYHGYEWFCPNGERRTDEIN